MPAVIEIFPEVAIELNREVAKHPMLAKVLSSLPPNTSLEERLGHVAAYCNVVVDDYYLEEDIEILLHMLVRRLKGKGTLIADHIH